MKAFVLQGHERSLTYLMFNRDGDLLFTCGMDKGVNLWYSGNGELVGTYEGHLGVVWACDVTFDSKRLITAGGDDCCKIFDVESGKILGDIKETGPCRFVQWCRHPNHQNKIVLCRDRFTTNREAICVWTVPLDDESAVCERKLEIKLETVSERNKWAVAAQWGAYDETIVSIHEDGSMKVWDSKIGSLLWDIAAHDECVQSFKMSEDRYIAVTVCRDKTAKLWDLLNRKCIKVYTLDRPLNAVAISPRFCSREGRRYHLIFGGGQEAASVTTETGGGLELVVVHMVHGEVLGTIKGHFGPIMTIDFMPEGGGFASGAWDGYVRLHHFEEDYWSNKMLE